jgi:hypothetical protein
MIKNLLFAAAVMSLALASGCAKGGNGVVTPPPAIAVTITTPTNTNALAIYPTQTLTLTATVSNATTTAVNWTCTPAADCAMFTPVTPPTTPATATYVAPATAGSQATITATLTAESSVTNSLTLNIIDITTDVSPTTVTVGSGLTQQFTAIALPDAAPQTFYWTCMANTVPCKSFSPGPGVSSPGLAVYTAQDSCSGSCVQISAASTLDSAGCSTAKNCTTAKVFLANSRVSGTYAFQFSGFDGNNDATAAVGTFTALNGVVTSGLEDRITASGWAKYAITGGSYTPTSSDPNNSNNEGTLTLTTGVYPNKFQVALDGAGDLEMIESDGQGTGSGIAQKSASSNLFAGDQTYAFGFTGVDSNGNRVGYAGILPMNGGLVAGGQMDVNDNGNDTNFCGAGPCSVAGSYTADPCNCGLWHMTISAGTASLLDFDFFISSGGTNKTNPLTFYAISTDPVATHPAVSGTMVLQDSTQTYDNAAFKGTSVSALAGTAVSGASNVSLTLGTTDGTSTSGSGNFSGQFDQNNAGTILSAVQFPPATGTNNYTYAASGTSGRYIFNMLGNPGASPVAAPLPFVLYASGANRGFLLDQSSSSVMTGTMNPQGKGGGILGGSTLPGTYAAASVSGGNYGVRPIINNLLLTSSGGNTPVYSVSGMQSQYPTVVSQSVTGLYTVNDLGAGTIALTAPPPPSPQNYVIYALDTLGCTTPSPVCQILDFLMIDEDKTITDPSIIFAQQ